VPWARHRQKRDKVGFREKGKNPKGQLALDFSEVGPAGLEPTTNGLKVPSEAPEHTGESPEKD